MTDAGNKRWWTWAVAAMGHISGVGVLLSINALLFVDANVISAVQNSAEFAEFYRVVTFPMMLQVGLASCIWALMVIIVRWGRLTLQEYKKSERVILKKSKGTIMTETLIIFPLFLLFTSGLAQLSINSTAGVLMAVGTFQASRTAWLWEPETRAQNPRNGMSGDEAGVNERARIAAATVLTPVVPAEFRGTCSFSQLFDERLRAIGSAGAFAGVAGADAVRALTTAGRSSEYREFGYARAFDGSRFAVRGAKKFYLAYCLTSAEHTTGGGDITTTVRYNHSNVFPWFAYIFGKRKLAAGNLGWYSEFRSSATLKQQINVNPREAMSIMSTVKDLVGRFF